MSSVEFSSNLDSKVSSESVFPGKVNQCGVNTTVDTSKMYNQRKIEKIVAEIESFATTQLKNQNPQSQGVHLKKNKRPLEEKRAAKPRVAYTKFQLDELNLEYDKNNKYITILQRKELSQKLNLSEQQIKTWFQNKRTKERKDERKKSSSKIVLPPISTFSPISHKHISENFYSSCWNEEKSTVNISGLPAGPLPQFSSPHIEEKSDSNNLSHSSFSNDITSMSLLLAPNENFNSSPWNAERLGQNNFLSIPLVTPLEPSPMNTAMSLSLHDDSINNKMLSFWSHYIQQSVSNQGLQYFNRWIYPFYNYCPPVQQFAIKQESSNEFNNNIAYSNETDLVNRYQGSDSQQNFNQVDQFPLDFVNSYNLGNHFMQL